MPADPDDLLSPLVEHAVELAAQWHDGTYRKSAWRETPFGAAGADVPVPAMAHLAAVASIVRRAGWDDPTVAAAYLHDTIEDRNREGQRLRRTQLREAMGPEVTRIVVQVSEQKLAGDGTLRSWRDRKDDYVAGLRGADVRAVAISLADKIHNLWSINQSLAHGTDIFAALSAGPEAQLWFHRAVLEASRDHTDDRLDPMRARLQRELDRLAQRISARADAA